MERPADLRIEDLARPHLSPAAREMMEGVVAASPPVEFTADALLSAACAETGLDDFGDDTFRAPLDVLLHSLEHEANLSPCLLYTSPSPRDVEESRMPSSA